MARTPLFARLSSLLAKQRNNHVAPVARLSRRAFVQRSLAGLAALSQLPTLTSCSDDTRGVSLGKDARLVIVGAGMAGLHCGYRLKQAGVTAQLYDAASRTGGRMFSAREGFLDGQVGELGGEFIDTGHLTMHALAEELGLSLEDREAALPDGVVREIWWIDGKSIPESTIVEQFKRVAPKMVELVEQAENLEDDSAFVMLDNTSLAQWLDDNLQNEPELKSVLVNAYRGEYGREVEEQSVLNLLYLIGAEEPEPFRIFGDSDERFHTRGGNQAFTDALAARLEGQVALAHKLTSVTGSARAGYRLTFEHAGESVVVEADAVVFAIPFTLLRQVDLSQLELSEDKRTVIEQMGYGTNAKVMAPFSTRAWQVVHDASGSVTSDLPMQQVWDTSLGQPGEAGILTNFLGGKQGEAAGEGSPDEWFRQVVVPGIHEVWSGRVAYEGKAQRMHWPSYAFTLGSYACYRPGQWSFWGTEGLPENRETLHFCGEHTSLDFQGYMEGAAETGALVAKALLDKMGVKASARLEALVHVRNAVPQPALSARTHARSVRARRSALARALAELVDVTTRAV